MASTVEPSCCIQGKKETSTELVQWPSMAGGACDIAATNGENRDPVAENGFISINPPLLPGRMASFSTRNYHPLFMSMLQELLVGLNIKSQCTHALPI